MFVVCPPDTPTSLFACAFQVIHCNASYHRAPILTAALLRVICGTDVTSFIAWLAVRREIWPGHFDAEARRDHRDQQTVEALGWARSQEAWRFTLRSDQTRRASRLDAAPGVAGSAADASRSGAASASAAASQGAAGASSAASQGVPGASQDAAREEASAKVRRREEAEEKRAQEAQRRELEAQQREQEVQRREEETRQRELLVQRREEAARQREQELQRREEEAQELAREVQRREEEAQELAREVQRRQADGDLLAEAGPFLHRHGLENVNDTDGNGHTALHLAIEALRLGQPCLQAALAPVRLMNPELLDRLPAVEAYFDSVHGPLTFCIRQHCQSSFQQAQRNLNIIDAQSMFISKWRAGQHGAGGRAGRLRSTCWCLSPTSRTSGQPCAACCSRRAPRSSPATKGKRRPRSTELLAAATLRAPGCSSTHGRTSTPATRGGARPSTWRGTMQRYGVLVFSTGPMQFPRWGGVSFSVERWS